MTCGKFKLFLSHLPLGPHLLRWVFTHIESWRPSWSWRPRCLHSPQQTDWPFGPKILSLSPHFPPYFNWKTRPTSLFRWALISAMKYGFLWDFLVERSQTFKSKLKRQFFWMWALESTFLGRCLSIQDSLSGPLHVPNKCVSYILPFWLFTLKP